MFSFVDIRDLSPFVLDEEIAELNIGDLHANPILMIYILHRYGVISLTQNHYNEMYNIYSFLASTPWLDKQLITQNVKRFIELTKAITFHQSPIVFRFIGDELADRGACDLFVIELLSLMHKNQIRYQILLSNHGLCFIESFTALKKIGRRIEQEFRMIEPAYMNSFWNFKTLYDWDVVNLSSVSLLLDKIYFPFIKLVDISFDAQKEIINIYTHAAIGVNDLRLLAFDFKGAWKDENLFQIGQSIIAIQQFFQTEKLPHLKKVFDESAMLNLEGKIHPELQFSGLVESRLWKLCWNREYGENTIYRPHDYKLYKINYFYGHDSSNEIDEKPHCICLDSPLGKLVEHPKSRERKIITSGSLKVYRQDVVSYEQRFAPVMKSKMISKSFQLSWNSILPCLGFFALGVYFKQFASDRVPIPIIHTILQQMMGNLLGTAHYLTFEMSKRR